MKKLIWFTTLAALFLVFIMPAILAFGIKMIPGSDQPGYNFNQRISIYGKREVSQKFVSEGDNLTAIGTSIRNLNLKNKKDIVLSLFDEHQTLIRKVVINGQNVQDGDFVKFIFDPVADSKNKVFIFTLSSPDAGPEDTIEVFYVENGYSGEDMPGWIEQYSYDQKVHSGGLPLVVFYKPISRWLVVREIYSNLFARLLH